MELLYIGTFMFRQQGGETFALPSCADLFFQKYLDVFENIRVIGDPVQSYIETNALVQMKDPRISVRVLVSNKTPLDFLNDREVLNALKEEISQSKAVLIKPATRKGMMAIKLCDKLNVPYMIEVTGDIHNALKQHPNLIKRTYASIYYRQILKSIKNCKYGLYVSKNYLQEQFPINGVTCGCSDVIIEKSDSSILDKRIQRIDKMDITRMVQISLIGFYQGKMKGVDTAIRALSQLPETYHLNILGNGTEENRNKWLSYGERLGVYDRIHFPDPLPNPSSVLQWLDEQDFFILPSRSEGLPRCCVEAMSRGCVCFATNICSMPELYDEDCLHPLDDDIKLANLIHQYSCDKSLMKIQAKRNFEKAKEYDFELLKERRNKFLMVFRKYCESFMNL